MTEKNIDNNKNELQAQPINTVSLQVEGSLEGAVQNAEKYFKLQDRIRKAALDLTSITDWIDENGKPYLQWQGTAKVARGLGVGYSSLQFTSEQYVDDKGEVLDYTVVGNVSWNGQTITEMGSGSSRDSFFGVRTRTNEATKEKEKYFLPLSEIDRTDIRKKAVTNFLNRGLKSLIGLSFTWAEITEITKGRITQEKIRAQGNSVSFDKGKKGGNTDTAELKTKKTELRKMIIDMHFGDEAKAKVYLQEKTKFKDYSGATSVDSLSENQYNIVHGKIIADYNKHLEQIKAAEQEGSQVAA